MFDITNILVSPEEKTMFVSAILGFLDPANWSTHSTQPAVRAQCPEDQPILPGVALE